MRWDYYFILDEFIEDKKKLYRHENRKNRTGSQSIPILSISANMSKYSIDVRLCCLMGLMAYDDDDGSQKRSLYDSKLLEQKIFVTFLLIKKNLIKFWDSKLEMRRSWLLLFHFQSHSNIHSRNDAWRRFSKILIISWEELIELAFQRFPFLSQIFEMECYRLHVQRINFNEFFSSHTLNWSSIIENEWMNEWKILAKHDEIIKKVFRLN